MDAGDSDSLLLGLHTTRPTRRRPACDNQWEFHEGDQQALFRGRHDLPQTEVTPLEMSEQQGTVLIKHVSARTKIARGLTSDMWVPHAGNSRPTESFPAVNLRQQTEASGVRLRDIQDCLRKCLKNGPWRIG